MEEADNTSAILEEVHILQDDTGEPGLFRLPRAPPPCFASDRSCSCNVYPLQDGTIRDAEVELCAMVLASEPHIVQLYCQGACLQRFPLPSGEIRTIQLIPLPAVSFSRDLKSHGNRAVAGVILIVATATYELSVHSIVLSEPSQKSPFAVMESLSLSSTDASPLQHRTIRQVTGTLVMTRGTPQCLLVATSSSSDTLSPSSPSSSSQQVVVQRYSLRKHRCPAFHFHSTAPFPNSSVVLDGE